MHITGLDHYNLRVPDEMLDSLCRFYAEVLNLDIGPRPPFRSRGFWLYAGEQPLLHLTASGAGSGTGPQSTGWFSHVAFKCTNLAAAEQALRAHGIVYEYDEVPELKQTQLFFTDPAGIGVELNFSEAL